ncbi:cupin domain-containing protein [Roseomonas elaeocarpi]|uniref:Cupin domain-containing protein n=1 Tax=Roseomonas elaeocarpi TaxID=907779 RepID=A0ABV6JM98_9PROT
MATTDEPGVILRPAELPAHERGGGARTIPLVGARHGAQGFMNGITIIAGGAAIPLHTHNCEEAVVLLEGEAIVEIDGAQHRLQPLDTSWIPAGVPHRFINASASESMKILWTYGRTDATRTLVATGETRPVSAEHAAAKGAARP